MFKHCSNIDQTLFIVFSVFPSLHHYFCSTLGTDKLMETSFTFPLVFNTIFRLIPGAPGGRKRDAVEALIMKHGSDAGLGKGFVSGSLMNFRSIVNIVAPAFFASMYQLGVRRKTPGFVFFTGALSVVAAECVWRSMTNVELGLDEEGRDSGGSRQGRRTKRKEGKGEKGETKRGTREELRDL